MDLSQEEINANIAKLRNKIGDVRTGGKGSQRRKVKVVSKNAVIFLFTQGTGDKVVKSLVKKTGAQQLGVDEVNFFRDDTVMHFSRPEAYASIQNNTFIVSGEPETKSIKDLLPDIIQQLGPKQHKILKDLVSGSGETAAEEEVPTLVETPDNLNNVEWSLSHHLDHQNISHFARASIPPYFPP